MASFFRIFALLVCTLLVPNPSRAGYGFFANGGTYVILNLNGGGNSYFQLSPSSANPNFHGSNLGNFWSGVNTLVLNGFENNTYENGGDGVMDGKLNYRIFTSGSPSGSYTQVNHIGFFDLGGGNKRHDVTNAGINVLSGLVPGTYQIEVFPWARVNWNGTDGGVADAKIFARRTLDGGSATWYAGLGDNPTSAVIYSATFTVSAVPEPASAAMMALGVAVLRLLTRKRR